MKSTPLTGRYARPLLRRLQFLSRQKLISLSVLLCSATGYAQAPTSLQYPASNTFATQTDYVYLAPTLSGVATSYSVSPALPAGLSINTTTGVISGVSTAASAAANYTITATNASGSTNTVVNIGVTNTFYDNALGAISFLEANRTFPVGNGQADGDLALYTNVTTIGGQAIDCIVKTVTQTVNTYWIAYDQLATAGTGYSNNDDKFFSPQLYFPGGGGSVTFGFQFILGGSFSGATNTGTNVTLQNVYLNTYDIDGNGGALSNQFNEFEGFAKSELAGVTNISAPIYNTANGLSRFNSSTDQNNSTVTDAIGRIRLTYNQLSNFTIVVGAGAANSAFFFVDLSIGIDAFSTAIATNNIALDLNTFMPGLDNADMVSGSAVNFTRATTTNVSSLTALNAVTLSYQNTAANLPDAANETIRINGTAGTYNHALNFATGSTSSVTVGGVAYTITKTVNGTTNTITFTNGGTFTLAQAEALVDAIQYLNTDLSPTNGKRNFSVRANNTQAASPVADYVPNLNAVSIAGNIYHDANGLTDNTVNGNGTMGQFTANGAYAVLTDASNAVLATTGISAGGAYSFGRRETGNYSIYISNSATPASPFSASTFPAGGYRSTGENLGTTAGNDGAINSKMVLTVGNIAVANANIGIEIPPAATDFTSGNMANPGGYNFYALPAANFNTTDADGTVQSITITAFPTGADYLKVGSTIYRSGASCAPQSVCVAWPGTLVVPFANLNTISVDPSGTGNTSVTVPYTAVDNGALRSNNNVATSVTIPFIIPATPITISGNVWNDADGDGVKDAAETFSNAANTGQTLYALLIQKTNTYSGANTVLASAAVSSTTGYTFSGVPSGNDYEVRIASLPSAPIDGVAKSTIAPAYATGYTGISTNNRGTITAAQNTTDLVNDLGAVTISRTGINFGIERAPETLTQTANIASPAINSNVTLNGGSNPPAFSGSDPEDQPTTGSLNTRTVAITSLPTNGQLWYNGTRITQGDDNLTVPSVGNPKKLTAFNPAQMQVRFTGSGYKTVTFMYAFVDAANIADATPATYTLNWLAALPVNLLSFSGKTTACATTLTWKTANETAISRYTIERSTDGTHFTAIGNVPANTTATGNEYSFTCAAEGKSIYRLNLVGTDGKSTYSTQLAITANCQQRNLGVWPNPTHGAITIKGLTAGDKVQVYSTDGRLVSSGTATANTVISLHQQPMGTYAVIVYNAANEQVYTTRIIKK